MAQKQYAGSSVYNRYLGANGFRGVDFSSHPSMVSEDRFSDMKNMWRDYHAGQGSAVETFPGYRLLNKFSSRIYGIFRYSFQNVDYIIVHTGTALYQRKLVEDDAVSFSQITITDGKETPTTINLSERPSSGFQFADSFYIIDGTNYIRVKAEISVGSTTVTFSGVSAESFAYIPKTWLNGTEYEQRNLLTNKFKEEWLLTGALNYTEGTLGLNYEITDTELKECKCTGFGTNQVIPFVYIPQTAEIEGQMYSVKSIADEAFELLNGATGVIREVVIASGVERIGASAFKCGIASTPALESVFLPETLVSIGESAFQNNTFLHDFYFYGEMLETIGENAFNNCGRSVGGETYIRNVFYNGSRAEFNSKKSTQWTEEGNDSLLSNTVGPQTYYFNYVWKLPDFMTVYVHERMIAPTWYVLDLDLDGVDLDQNKYGYYAVGKTEGGTTYVNRIQVYSLQPFNYILQGKRLTINGTLDQSKFSSYGKERSYIPFYGSQEGYTGTMLEAVKNCTQTVQFDGRVFFSSNPDLPNTVFYSHRNLTGHNDPSYIGAYNYFDVGIGASPNKAMISTGSHLIILKDNTVQDGAINLYEGVSSDDDVLPRYYIRTQGLPGIGCLSAACNFSDDPVFVTTRGLDAVGTQTVNLERTVQHRSSNIDRKLLNEDLENAVLTEWDGYLVLLCGSHAYLADSRQVFTHKTGVYQYEWYYLDDIGSYSGDNTAYFRREDEKGNEKKYAYDSVSSTTDGEGVTHYYFTEDGEEMEVYPSTERSGGTFSPAVIAVGIDDFLFFGTGDGSLLLVNTDKRGTPPTGKIGAAIVVGDGENANYTAEEYSDLFGDIIPREWYSHCDHAYSSYVTLASENAGIPHLTKSTVRKSCVVHFKNVFGADPKYNVKTDREEWVRGGFEIGANMPDFADTNFDVTSFKTSQGYIVNLAEHRRKWVEKQFQFFSEECYRPFGLYDIAYQYIIEGRVKNR